MSYVPDTIDYDMYAKMDYWNFAEAIWLAVSYTLSNRTYASKDEYLSEFEKESNSLSNILYRSLDSNAIVECAVSYNVFTDGLPALNKSYVIPYWFIDWISKKGYDLPAELKEIKLSEVRISDIEYMFNQETDEYNRSIDCGIDAAEVVTERDVAECLNAKKSDNNLYRFEKTAQSWNLQFGEIELIGVKDLVGMDYIATLLKNPGIPIGVINIQAMLHPAGIKLPGSKQRGEFEDQEEPSTAMNGNYARSSKSKSLENLKRRLQELSQERNKLDSDYDHIGLEAIDNEYAKIEAEIDNIMYSKNDDPEIKKNRDKVAKAIKAAIENIRGLKTKGGHSSAPICNFLTQHIKTASECIYNPPTINPPGWSF